MGRRAKSRRGKPAFGKALDDAKGVLASKIKQRDKAMEQLRKLNVEIPNLERTVRALQDQLNPPKMHLSEISEMKIPKQIFSIVESVKQHSEDATGADYKIPADVLASLPADYRTEEEKFLPEVTGKDLTPEKNK